jgi:3-mercaptopyruvate sulfurtransferase SseA
MNNAGIPNVFALKGGTPAWRDAKYPMSSGEKP